MTFSFIQVRGFTSRWRSLGLSDEDLQALEAAILSRPEAGPVMQGTAGLRKMRFAPPTWHTGKSGAIRVCYAIFRQYALIYLVTLFTKNESDNLTPTDAGP